MYYNRTYSGLRLTIKALTSIYKKHKITKKKIIRKPYNFNKYDDDKMKDLLIKLQYKLLNAEIEGRLILQLDESIFNAQQH